MKYTNSQVQDVSGHYAFDLNSCKITEVDNTATTLNKKADYRMAGLYTPGEEDGYIENEM